MEDWVRGVGLKGMLQDSHCSWVFNQPVVSGAVGVVLSFWICGDSDHTHLVVVWMQTQVQGRARTQSAALLHAVMRQGMWLSCMWRS